jgi:hypothetical protein
MTSDQNKEDLEKLKSSLTQHIRAIEDKNKKLRQKQEFLLKLAERLRKQELMLSQKISQIAKEQNPYLQILSIDLENICDGSIILFLN